MSFDGIIQILPQYPKSARVFGEEIGIRIEVTHAEACMSHDNGIRGSIKGSTSAQTTRNIGKVVSESPQ